MKPFKFIPPNFIAQVSKKDEVDQKKSIRIFYADDKDSARRFLDQKDFTVHSIEEYNFKEKWLERAKKISSQANTVCSKGEKYNFESIWSELKEHLFDLSHGKCVFCEAKIKHNQYGDVEHFRPKGEVSGEKTHRGYYWLAYEPSNYFPSCISCNQTNKKNQFPILGNRAFGPSDPLEAEDPLLLNPSDEKLWKHVKVYPSNDQIKAGYAEGLDEKGKKTIEILKLNRSDLKEMRIYEQAYFRVALGQAWALTCQTGDIKIITNFLNKLKDEDPQFYTASIWEVNNFYMMFNWQPPEFD